jgi:hypothetical protein
MGQSVDAHIGFGWIMPEDDEDDLFDLVDQSDVLEIGFAGSMYAGEMQTIIYYDKRDPLSNCETSVSTYWEAKPFGDLAMQDSGWQVRAEAEMRLAAKEIGLELPDESAQWILWPCLG